MRSRNAEQIMNSLDLVFYTRLQASGQPVHVKVVLTRGAARHMLSVSQKHDEDMFQRFEGLRVDVLSDEDEWSVILLYLLYICFFQCWCTREPASRCALGWRLILCDALFCVNVYQKKIEILKAQKAHVAAILSICMWRWVVYDSLFYVWKLVKYKNYRNMLSSCSKARLSRCWSLLFYVYVRVLFSVWKCNEDLLKLFEGQHL